MHSSPELIKRQNPPAASPFGSGVGLTFGGGQPKATSSPFGSVTIGTHRGFEPTQPRTTAPAPPPPVVPSATVQDIPPPPPQTPAQREAADKAKAMFEALEYAFQHPPQPVAGSPGTYVVREPGTGRYHLWRSDSATDQDTLTDMAELAEGANEPEEQTEAAMRWRLLAERDLHSPRSVPTNRRDRRGQPIPGDRAGEYTYEVAVAVMGGAAPLQPKASSVLSGRQITRQALLVLYSTCRNRFERQAVEWMDTWANGKLERENCIAHLAGRCHNPNCRRVHVSWSNSEISGEGGTDITRHYNDRSAPRFDGPMSPMGERQPRGDGLAVAELMGQTATASSIDTVHRHVLQQFKRGSDSTPRRDNRSAIANPQPYIAPLHSAAQAAADRTSIANLAAANSTWGIVQAAIATGADIDVSQKPNQAEIDSAAAALEQLLQRTAEASVQR